LEQNDQSAQNSINHAKSQTLGIMKIIIEESIMLNYDLDDEVKKGLADDLNRMMEHNSTAPIEDRYMPPDIAQELSKRLDGNLKLAEIIEYTETMRASNLASWSQNLVEESTHFIVDYSYDACDKCIDEYEGKVFTIDQTDKLPPIHYHCDCVPSFFASEEDAQVFADEISQGKPGDTG
jgi:hypothetical protein